MGQIAPISVEKVARGATVGLDFCLQVTLYFICRSVPGLYLGQARLRSVTGLLCGYAHPV